MTSPTDKRSELTREQIEAFRKEHLMHGHADGLAPRLEPWAVEENRVLNALCDGAIAALSAERATDYGHGFGGMLESVGPASSDGSTSTTSERAAGSAARPHDDENAHREQVSSTLSEWPHGKATLAAASPLPTYDENPPQGGRSAGFLLYCHVYEARWAALKTAEYCPQWNAISPEVKQRWEELAGNIATEVARKSTASAKPATNAIPDELFDGYAVWRALGENSGVSPRNVSAVLDAVVRLIRSGK